MLILQTFPLFRLSLRYVHRVPITPLPGYEQVQEHLAPLFPKSFPIVRWQFAFLPSPVLHKYPS